MNLGNFRRFFFDAPRLSLADINERLARHVFMGLDVVPPAPDEEPDDVASGFVDVETGEPRDDLAQTVGEYVVTGWRVDTRKIPKGTLDLRLNAEIRRVKREQKVDVLNKYQVAELRENVVTELRRRAVPAVKTYTLVLDMSSGIAYVGVTSPKVVAEINEALEKCFDLHFRPDCIYTRGGMMLPEARLDRFVGLNPFDPTALVNGLDGEADADDEARDQDVTGGDFIDRAGRVDHLGGLFLLWLWWRSGEQGGKFVSASGSEFELWFDDRLTMVGAALGAQEDAFKGGHPVSSLEARTALRLGKMPAQARVRVVFGDSEWSATLRVGPAVGGLVVDGLRMPALLGRDLDDRLCEDLLNVERFESYLDDVLLAFLTWRMDVPGWAAEIVQWARESA
jgi:hypothetical protein